MQSNALVYGAASVLTHLNWAITEMEKDCDEPRLSQMLSRRAIIKLRDADAEVQAFAREDASRARDLAEKYHEPHLLALSALALAIRREESLTTAILAQLSPRARGTFWS